MPSGPGGNDSEGVYRYGEADTGTGLFSDLLNLLAASISTVLGNHRTRLAALEARPTSVLARSTTVNVTTVAAAIPFSSAPKLVGFTWSSTVNPSRLTAIAAMHALVSFPRNVINTTANAIIYTAVNGVEVPGSRVTVAGSGGAAVFTNYMVNLDLAAGDYVEVFALLTGTSPQPWAAANRLNVDSLGAR